MNSLKDLAWNVTEEEYRADPAISYSTLSTYAKKGIDGLKDIVDGVKFSSPSLRHGSLVDTLLTDNENFDNLYVVADYKSPTEVIKNIIDEIYENNKAVNYTKSLDEYSEEFTSLMSETINKHNYGGDNWKAQTKINKVLEDGRYYYNLLLSTGGTKELVAQVDYDYADRSVNEIKNNEFTSWVFKARPGIEIHFQLKFKINFKYKIVDSKLINEYTNPLQWKESVLEKDTIRCMFDIILVDHNKKIIYPIDLKTTSYNEEDFQNAFDAWRYDLQSTKYSYILREVIAQDEYFKDFKVAPFMFLPINKIKLNPQFFVDYLSTSNEIPDIVQGNKVHLAWYKYLDSVRWHLDNNNFRYTKETVTTKGFNRLIR